MPEGLQVDDPAAMRDQHDRAGHFAIGDLVLDQRSDHRQPGRVQARLLRRRVRQLRNRRRIRRVGREAQQ